MNIHFDCYHLGWYTTDEEETDYFLCENCGNFFSECNENHHAYPHIEAPVCKRCFEELLASGEIDLEYLKNGK